MLTAVIVDDVKKNAKDLEQVIKKYAADKVTVAAIANTFDDAYKMLTELEPDVVFLDVELDNNKTSFELLNKLERKKFDIIFCTGYEKYAVRAFQFSAIDYLLKPADADLLINAIDRVIEKKSSGKTQQTLDVLNKILSKNPLKPHLMRIDGKEEERIIDVKDIICIMTNGRAIAIDVWHQDKLEVFTTNKTIIHYEEMFDGFDDFLKVSQSCIINLDFIEKINKDSTVNLKHLRSPVDISKTRIAELRNKMLKA